MPNHLLQDVGGAASDREGHQNPPQHLIVLVYGVGGTIANWTYLKRKMEAAFGPAVLVLCADTVRASHLGIDMLGSKLADEVEAAVRATPSLTKISFVGHSLGGLMARYAVGVLLGRELSSRQGDGAGQHRGPAGWMGPRAKLFMRPDADEGADASPGGAALTICGLQPVNFITLASPHLGSRGRGQVPFLALVGFLERVTPRLSALVLGETAKQLFLSDSPTPVLLRMTTDCPDAPFLSALAAFKHRRVYANIACDQLVGWQTSSIRPSSEMPPLHSLVEHPEYKYIVVSVADEPNGVLLPSKGNTNTTTSSSSSTSNGDTNSAVGGCHGGNASSLTEHEGEGPLIGQGTERSQGGWSGSRIGERSRGAGHGAPPGSHGEGGGRRHSNGNNGSRHSGRQRHHQGHGGHAAGRKGKQPLDGGCCAGEGEGEVLILSSADISGAVQSGGGVDVGAAVAGVQDAGAEGLGDRAGGGAQLLLGGPGTQSTPGGGRAPPATSVARADLRKSVSGFLRSSSSELRGAEWEDEMAANLGELEWERVDVSFNSLKLGFLAHNIIQVKDYWVHKAGASIIRHLIEHFEV